MKGELDLTMKYIPTLDRVRSEKGLGRVIYHDLASTGMIEFGRFFKLAGLLASTRFKFGNGLKFWKGFYINQSEYAPLKNEIDNLINPRICNYELTDLINKKTKDIYQSIIHPLTPRSDPNTQSQAA